MKSPRKQNKLHVILNNLVTVKFSSNDKYFWGRETKIVKELVKKYGEDFMMKLAPPEGYKQSSMVYFKTKDGQDYLNGKYFEYKCANGIQIKKEESVELSKEKIGEDAIIERKKPRTLKEFLTLYGKDNQRTT